MILLIPRELPESEEPDRRAKGTIIYKLQFLTEIKYVNK